MLESSVWGKNKGCSFMMKQSCNFEQFCQTEGEELCNWDHTAIARCQKDRLADGCNTASNIIYSCLQGSLDNRYMSTYEYYGSDSRCFKGNLKAQGSVLQSNHRCYRSHCIKLRNFSFIEITVIDKVYRCLYPCQKIRIADARIEGTLQCP